MSARRWTCSTRSSCCTARERDLARAYYAAILAQIRLKQSVGRLTPVDLDNVNRLLRPTP